MLWVQPGKQASSGHVCLSLLLGDISVFLVTTAPRSETLMPVGLGLMEKGRSTRAMVESSHSAEQGKQCFSWTTLRGCGFGVVGPYTFSRLFRNPNIKVRIFKNC